MGLLTKIFGTYSDKELKQINKIIKKINSLEATVQNLSDDELKGKTDEFKKRYKKGESLDKMLPEAFAVIREVSRRVLGKRHYDVQLIGGIILHQGRIAEMKTGEGKTLVSAPPAYLNSISGDGVHIITVNDYLAQRDCEINKPIYDFLGVSVAPIVHGITSQQRKEAYACDITYGTNNEFGFDYLRDNMVIFKEERVQRGLNFVIIDEIDSVLIDDARTPLIISGAADKSTDFYRIADYFSKTLNEDDYKKDEKTNSVILTEDGVKKAETFFKVDNYADPQNMSIQHHVSQSLRANYAMKRDKDYIVVNGKVEIIDDNTGRVMEGRRYGDGLHQAIEAKEGVKVEKESKTLATISYQNLFRMYKKLSGMTGTAATEENEFREIYSLDIVVVPTNKPIKRVDYSDKVFKTESGKIKAIIKDIEESNLKGQPVLVVTPSISKAENMSDELRRRGMKHQLLTAKSHEKEAEIVAQAGQAGMITVATNMAGRGTDIKLGKGVPEAGGLKIIGTERAESRRVDGQMKGRAGRQGDPGSSRFYISLDDDLMRIFGSDRLKVVVDRLGLSDDDAIESKFVSKAIENAQKNVEGNNFDVRKSLIGYDDVINKQREIIYSQRSRVLEGENLKEQIISMIEDVVSYEVNLHLVGSDSEDSDLNKLIEYMEMLYVPVGLIKREMLEDLNIKEITDKYISIAKKIYAKKEEEFGEKQLREVERVILLRVVDLKWMDHINNMDHLKQGIGLRAYKQQDPIQAYQYEGSAMFEEMIMNIKLDTIKYLMHVREDKTPKRERVAMETGTNEISSDVKSKPVRKNSRVGRNDICTCGSGKKYKSCCGKNL
ncbi:preprotein translocase subunit SecA [Candidatus Arthromitus sp. SFB-rat-Yit]|uniref:preprotein translocase subunit SecA n=1 Tax=Candidatus Arthromitus sp. SFB-rat-Yit TaxID=1041504 RepID=UPI000227A5FB|nr:preprotein translocase subunit SecA [Candidatus Arthromitus sp. SFB-rat-Yit]BAK81656.1 preprotein translocase, SecA subunit [Candidatus Arthromitus sp. SFB-rat-Yit]